MTNEEAVKQLIEMGNALQIIPTTSKGKALLQAIKSLKAWDKVKDDIRQMYFTKPITVRNEVLDIINKHLQEVENDN